MLNRDCEDDPLLIWDTLKASFVQQRTAPCFNAYHTLLSNQLDAVIQSLRNMDQTRSNLSGTSAAFSASSAPPRLCFKVLYKPQSTPSTPSTSNPLTSATSCPICGFCTTPGHVETECFLKQHLLYCINPPYKPTASPASTSSQSLSDTPQSASAASASALPHSSMTLTPPGMQILAPQLI